LLRRKKWHVATGLFAGDNDTCNKSVAGIYDTRTVEQLLAVTTTPLLTKYEKNVYLKLFLVYRRR
jgi:hypothetical protein